MWMIIIKMGLPKHLTDLVSKLYEDQESAVRTGVDNTEWFSIGRGLRQGCILSLSLFNVYSEDMREALHGFEGGVHFGGERITDLRYAARTANQNMLNIWKSRGLSIDLKPDFLEQLCFLLPYTAVSRGHQQNMTAKGLMPLNCGATEDFSGYLGRIKNQQLGVGEDWLPTHP